LLDKGFCHYLNLVAKNGTSDSVKLSEFRCLSWCSGYWQVWYWKVECNTYEKKPATKTQ